MTNTTEQYWDADGDSLQTYARNIESWGEGRWSVPPLRGDDDLVPFVPGERWLPKFAGPRVITLAGWVLGVGADGQPNGDQQASRDDNWRSLRRLLWRTDRQVALTKRWVGLDGVLHSAVGLCEYQSGLDPASLGVGGAKFTVDLKLAFPYFQGARVNLGTHAGVFYVNNVGDDTTRIITLTFSGAASLINHTTGHTLNVPDACTITVDRFTTTGAEETITTSGSPYEKFWMSFVRDFNFMEVTAGTVTASYVPLYV